MVNKNAVNVIKEAIQRTYEKQRSCQYCDPTVMKPLDDVFNSRIQNGNELWIPSWDCETTIEIEYCPMCAKRLQKLQ